jgi:antitoxin (DNA-binding transcriptional repressor) of toxin-antitoxin stability system
VKRAKIGQLKNQLSEFLSFVRKGGVVRVYDRDTPIADIVPLQPSELSAEGGLTLLEDKGIASPPQKRLSSEIKKKLLASSVRPSQAVDVAAQIMEERRSR